MPTLPSLKLKILEMHPLVIRDTMGFVFPLCELGPSPDSSLELKYYKQQINGNSNLMMLVWGGALWESRCFSGTSGQFSQQPQ